MGDPGKDKRLGDHAVLGRAFVLTGGFLGLGLGVRCFLCSFAVDFLAGSMPKTHGVDQNLMFLHPPEELVRRANI